MRRVLSLYASYMLIAIIGMGAAALFLGAVVVVAGLIGTFVGGFAATAWRRQNAAAYGLVLGCSTLAAVPAAVRERCRWPG